MPPTASSLARALDALATFGSLEAAAEAAGCRPEELIAALRRAVRDALEAEPAAPSSSLRRRRRAHAPDEDQALLPGLGSDDGASVIPLRDRVRPASKSSPAPAEPVPVRAASVAREMNTGRRATGTRLAVVPPPILVHVDAGARGNPGPSACAFVAATERGELVRGRFLGRRTNNEAEYEGLLEALRWLGEEGRTGARIHMDSQLVVMQVNGAWKVRESRLQSLAAEARALLASTRSTLVHVRREKNVAADREVNRILDEACS